MKVICAQKSLVNGIQTVQKGISNKIGLPIYSGTLFEVTKDNKIHLFSTDLELGIDCYISAQIIQHGSVVIPNKIFSDLIRKFSEGNIEIESGNDNVIHIKENHSEYKILGFSAEEFSPFPSIKSKAKMIIPQVLLKESLQKVIFATSKDESRSFLNGVLFKSLEDGIEIVATDSHRLALKKIDLTQNKKVKVENQFEVIIPQRTLSELLKLLSSEEDRMLEIKIGEKQVIFILDPNGEKNKIRLFSRMIEGQFPDYHQIIPKDFKTIVKVNTDIFRQRVERINLFVKEDINTIKMEVNRSSQNPEVEGRGELRIQVNTPDIGDAYEEIPCTVKGEYVSIAFNARYIIDVLKVIKTDDTEIQLNENLNPAIIRPIEKKLLYDYVLMPVRMD